ncbi:MAG: DUF3105 domain-containing protein [Actinomycetota bacterium]|nr:DUF3105 domain-containing protein [Actinomycetota bacterium]
MSSRQEEKERRKAERLERERAEAATAKRKRLVQIVGGVVVAAAIAVGVVIATTGGKDTEKADKRPANLPAIPARQITDLEDAAKTAGCALTHPPIEGDSHVTDKVEYKTNPPTSGDHVPPDQVARDGNYAGVETPAKERYVHSLEHGRVIIHYKPGLDERRIKQLETLFYEDSKTAFGLDSKDGGYTLLMKNNTAMAHEVAVTAWGHLLACKTFNDEAFDAIRAFRQRYVLQAPEKVTDPE